MGDPIETHLRRLKLELHSCLNCHFLIYFLMPACAFSVKTHGYLPDCTSHNNQVFIQGADFLPSNFSSRSLSLSLSLTCLSDWDIFITGRQNTLSLYSPHGEALLTLITDEHDYLNRQIFSTVPEHVRTLSESFGLPNATNSTIYLLTR